MLKWFDNPQELDDDRRLFAAGEAILDEEGMEAFLTALQEEKSYRPQLRNRVLAYMTSCAEIAPQFKDRQLREKGKALAGALKELKIHTGRAFSRFSAQSGRGRSAPCLAPRLLYPGD